MRVRRFDLFPGVLADGQVFHDIDSTEELVLEVATLPGHEAVIEGGGILAEELERPDAQHLPPPPVELPERQVVGLPELELPLLEARFKVLGDVAVRVRVGRMLPPPEGEDMPAVLGSSEEDAREVVPRVAARTLDNEQPLPHGRVRLGDDLRQIGSVGRLADESCGRLERAEPSGGPGGEGLEGCARIGEGDLSPARGVGSLEERGRMVHPPSMVVQ